MADEADSCCRSRSVVPEVAQHFFKNQRPLPTTQQILIQSLSGNPPIYLRKKKREQRVKEKDTNGDETDEASDDGKFTCTHINNALSS